VNLVEGTWITFNTGDLAFSTDPTYGIWDSSLANSSQNSNAAGKGVSAVTLFSYGQYMGRQIGGSSTDPKTRSGFINESGQFLPINYYTGQMFPRK
jgi:hypothetical protein